MRYAGRTMSTIFRKTAVLLMAAAAMSVIACSNSSSNSGSGISCVLEGDAGDQCLCFYGQPAAGAVVVTNCSPGALKGTTTCCGDNGWPSNSSGDAICECATYNTGCPTQVASCSAGTSAKPVDGG
jgi:hypothetical protein